MRRGTIRLGAMGIGLLLGVLARPAPALAACGDPESSQATKSLVAGVSDVDLELRKVQLGASSFWVADGVPGLEGLEPGAIVRIRHRCQNDRDTVIEIELKSPAPVTGAAAW